MTDRVKRPDKYGRHPIATIPDEQIERLKFVLFNTKEPVTIESTSICRGERIEVVRGCLMGLRGYVDDISNSVVSVHVEFGTLGVITVLVDLADIDRKRSVEIRNI